MQLCSAMGRVRLIDVSEREGADDYACAFIECEIGSYYTQAIFQFARANALHNVNVAL